MKQKDLKKGNGFFVNVFAGSIVLSMQIMSIHMELKSQLKYVKKRSRASFLLISDLFKI